MRRIVWVILIALALIGLYFGLLPATIANPGNGYTYGIVSDADTGSALEGVSVRWIDNTGAAGTIYTNNIGYYQFYLPVIRNGNPTWPYSITYTLTNYQFQTIVISLYPYNGLREDVALTSTLPPPPPNPPLEGTAWITPGNPVINQQVTFSATVSGGITPYTFSWTFGDGTSGNGNPAYHTYTIMGGYGAVLTVASSDGQTATAHIDFEVGAPPLDADFSFTPTYPVVGQTVYFTPVISGGSPPYANRWEFGDGGTSAYIYPTHIYLSSGIFTVTFYAYDGSGQIVSVSRGISVSAGTPPPPPPPPPPLTATISGFVHFQGNPISAATVVVSSEGRLVAVTLTGIDGIYSVVVNAYGTYSIIVSSSGFKDATATVSVGTLDVFQTFNMVPSGATPPFTINLSVITILIILAVIVIYIFRRRLRMLL